jgi:hypothetical protein
LKSPAEPAVWGTFDRFALPPLTPDHHDGRNNDSCRNYCDNGNGEACRLSIVPVSDKCEQDGTLPFPVAAMRVPARMAATSIASVPSDRWDIVDRPSSKCLKWVTEPAIWGSYRLRRDLITAIAANTMAATETAMMTTGGP